MLEVSFVLNVTQRFVILFAGLMWPYILMFLAALATDLLPIIGPPVWTVMVFMLVKFDLNPWLVLAVGVPGSVLGRYGLSLYLPAFFGKIIKQAKRDELKFVGQKLAGSLWRSWSFVLLYSLTPLSTTALFAAAGLARIKPFWILPPFFIGKFVSDAVMLFSGRYAMRNSVDLIYGTFSWKGLVTISTGLLVGAVLLFLDWRLLLERKQARLNFKIWK
jgi:membrane protein YqaA with SNARE-associated domain